MRPRISIRGFVHLWVRPSVGPSVRRSRVSQISRKSRLWDNKTSGNNEFKLIQLNSSKFKQIQENSFILTYVGRIFVRIELVGLIARLFGVDNHTWAAKALKVDSDISFRGDSSTANGTASCPHDASYTRGTNEMSTPLRWRKVQ